MPVRRLRACLFVHFFFFRAQYAKILAHKVFQKSPLFLYQKIIRKIVFSAVTINWQRTLKGKIEVRKTTESSKFITATKRSGWNQFWFSWVSAHRASPETFESDPHEIKQRYGCAQWYGLRI